MAHHKSNIGFFAVSRRQLACCSVARSTVGWRAGRGAKIVTQHLVTNNCTLTVSRNLGEPFSARQLELA